MSKMVKSAMSAQSHIAPSSSSQADSLPKSTATIKMRLLVSLLVLITMGLLCQLCQILCTSGGGMSSLASALILFVAFFGHVWMGVHSNALTRARKAFFDEANVLETYQPRARTMGHLFCPEPPTPAPAVKFSEGTDENKEKHTAEENAAFNAMRDSHYANMFEYAMKMQKELQAMEKAGKGPNSGKKGPESIGQTSATQSNAPQDKESPKKSPENKPPDSKEMSI